MSAWTNGPFGTPGPWEHRLPNVIARSHRIVGNGVTIAEMDGRNGWQEIEANARLIAAAPEMAEALEKLDMVLYDMACAASEVAPTALFERMTTERRKVHAILARIKGA